jgi:hypothetical protein
MVFVPNLAGIDLQVRLLSFGDRAGAVSTERRPNNEENQKDT